MTRCSWRSPTHSPTTVSTSSATTGDGQNFELLHTATGIGTTDLGTERCVRSGAQEQWRTGFLLPSDGFTGTWTLTVNQDYQDGPASMQDLNAQVEVEVIDNPLSIAEWPTR